MLLDEHGNFAGCELDSEVFTTAEPDRFFTAASQVLRRSSDSTRNEELKAAA